MLIDSHCHLNRLDLTAFDGNLNNALEAARKVGVAHFLCVSVQPEDVPTISQITETYPDVSMSVGVHPNEAEEQALSADALEHFAKHPKCIALGETGLDYYRTTTDNAIKIQQESFRTHISVSKKLEKPLIIHTRNAIDDTLQIMSEEKADEIGGVMHCFSENLDVAMRAIALNFYISLSGIVTFKNAHLLHEVAQKIPLDKMLIETDSPYLAPTPYRGKPNHPAWVMYVAKKISELRNVSYETIAKETTNNFYRCFKLDNPNGNK